MTARTSLTLAAALAVGLGTGAAADTRGVTGTSVIIGSHTDLSGPLASWGVPATNGARMRFDDQNAAGGVHGRKIDFKVEDTQYQVPLTVRATNRLVQRDNVFAIILGAGTAQSMASYEITDKLGIPNVFPLSAARSMAYPTHPLHVSYFVSYQDQAVGAIRYFHETAGIKSVCLQTQSSEYGEEVTEGVTQGVEAHGLTLAMVGTHRTTETEFAGVATAIRNANCDLIYLGTTGRDTIALYTTLRQLGVTVPIVGNMVSYLPVVAKAAGGAMEGLYVVSPVADADWTDGDAFRTDFITRYRAAFKEEPTVQSQVGWISADLLIKALEAAGPELTEDALMKAIEGISHYTDPFGGPDLSFSADKRFGGNSLTLLQVENSAWAVRQADLPF
ncbi:amino acid/amide ABC transporter substrate-binding protein, HAAT family [Gemmobacter megaterium]|uniref:Amino acid/amide ABC transporter substrate-binding protein, HAAT family n=1 Tax=Gemmobacter megaterium TaxID=1086013 RepID=A0A1N7N0L5_9RHOB|nr:ABC transporter substrate-binding protein [Gemmobacter megaterium]GGE12184.1 branched-chain amino acid-binding protein [Gemmobacter megaterium]SIS91731.1 amino acid/amide ABC transporter substrate-binding protein, HAAT family [Gemmobacter megaterium]